MMVQSRTRLNSMFSLLSLAAGAVIILIACYVLAAWEVDISFLESIIPGWPKMMPITAASFILSGISLCLLCAPAVESQTKIVTWGELPFSTIILHLLGKLSALVVSLMALMEIAFY